jgi:hypothetical protein
MTSWGNTKQRAAFWSAIALFVLAILCAIESTNGAAIVKGIAGLALLSGLICFVGVWTLSTPKNPDAEAEQW